MYVVVAIPARLESSRLPNKVLAEIGGEPMIKRVLRQCSKAELIDELFLCTDDEFLNNKAVEWGFRSIKTSKKCNSGSSRIASVIDKLALSQKLEDSLIINVQGDQPIIKPEVIDRMVLFAKSKKEIPNVITPIYKIKNKDIHDPNLVKTLVTSKKEILYFYN